MSQDDRKNKLEGREYGSIFCLKDAPAISGCHGEDEEADGRRVTKKEMYFFKRRNKGVKMPFYLRFTFPFFYWTMM